MSVDLEGMGVFYLGRRVETAAGEGGAEPLLYDSKDLLTHALCVGMTGSGKTGLCISLLEEAALDGIPVIAIDPKGDIGNLLLTFPELRPEDFEPWVDTNIASRRGLDTSALAAEEAQRWREGIEGSGQSAERIARLRASADIAIYTPGSQAGIPLSILRSFDAPESSIREDRELLRDRVASTVTGLLGLLGIDGDPMQSREHVLLSKLLETAFDAGKGVDLPWLIGAVQAPPFEKVGVLELDDFYPRKERLSLATAMNNLLAAPSFAAWLEGEPLDIAQLLMTREGKPRISILSIAHLDDAQRMFFVTLLLEQVLGFIRSQSGTSSLRAILYMDEIFGYFPPVANPPSKRPLLTLLKQARAFGLGIVLATQNPVDLDYKGLTNAGTWFLGRLQSERDKLRVLEGLEGASSASGGSFDRARFDALLSGLGKRVFLMHNVNDAEPTLFRTRFALSYLRGPLSRTDVKRLMDGRRPTAEPAPAARTSAPAPLAPTAAALAAPSVSAAPLRPALAPDVPVAFLPLRQPVPSGATVVYRPMIYGAARIPYESAKHGVDVADAPHLLAAIEDGPLPLRWGTAYSIAAAPAALTSEPPAPGTYLDIPSSAREAKQLKAFERDLKEYLYANYRVVLRRSPTSGIVSTPGEPEAEFRLRAQQAARELRDDQLEKLRRKYAPKVDRLDKSIRRAEAKIAKEQSQIDSASSDSMWEMGSAVLGMFGSSRRSVSARGKAIARSRARADRSKVELADARKDLAQLQTQRTELEAELSAAIAQLEASIAGEVLEEVTVRPKKSAIDVKLVALAWAPYVPVDGGPAQPLY